MSSVTIASSAKLSRKSTCSKGCKKKRKKSKKKTKSKRSLKTNTWPYKYTRKRRKKKKAKSLACQSTAMPPPRRSRSTNSRPRLAQRRTMRTDSASSIHSSNADISVIGGIRKLDLKTTSETNISNSSRSRPQSSVRHPLEDIAHSILTKKAKNIVVMAGAGISTASGIPDFRTPGTGLYDNLARYHIPYAEAIFNIQYFHKNPKPFYTLAKELYPDGQYRPNYVHYFLRLLHHKGILLRLYTQNIDGLEKMCGIPSTKLVESHGSFQTASCTRCQSPHVPDQIKDAIYANKIPRCKMTNCTGMVKPDIVFFGEDLPRRFYYYMRDFPQADLLLVMGTSLEVEPFADIVGATRMYVPRVLFNRSLVGPFAKKRRSTDYFSEGDLVNSVKTFVKMLGWSTELDKLIDQWEKELLIQFPIPPCVNDRVIAIEDDLDSTGVSPCNSEISTTSGSSSNSNISNDSSGQDNYSDSTSGQDRTSTVNSSSSSTSASNVSLQTASGKNSSNQPLFYRRSTIASQRGNENKNNAQPSCRPPIAPYRPAASRPGLHTNNRSNSSSNARATQEAGVLFKLAQQRSNNSAGHNNNDNFLPKLAYRHRVSGVKSACNIALRQPQPPKNTRNVWQARTSVAKKNESDSSSSSSDDTSEDSNEDEGD